MKILFVVADLSMEPLGILYLSSILKQSGHKTRLAVINAEDVLSKALRFKPDVIAYGMHTGVQSLHMEINSKLKQKMDFFSAFGGPHPTFFPEIIENKNVDGVCRGEGEYALGQLVKSLEEGKSLEGLENWWIRQNNEIKKNPQAPLITNLDTIPFPDREILRHKEFLLKYPRHRLMMTARGCPYSCTYCFNHAYVQLYGQVGHSIRRRTVDNVIEEALKLKLDYGTKFIYFADDTFNLMTDWLAEFADKFSRKVGIPFLCNIRANAVTEERMRSIAKAGAYSVCMGIETGNEQLRRVVLRREMTNKQIIRAALIVHNLGLKLFTANIVGIPGGTLDNDLETLRLNHAVRPHATAVTFMQPYPRTEIREYAASLGLLEGTVKSLPSSYLRPPPIKMEAEQRRQMENLHHLFGILAKMPWLMPLARFLLKLPLTKIYRPIFYAVFNEILTHIYVFKVRPSFEFQWRATIKPWFKARSASKRKEDKEEKKESNAHST